MALSVDPIQLRLQRAELKANRPSGFGVVSAIAQGAASARRNAILAQGETAIRGALTELEQEGAIDPSEKQQFEMLDYSNPEVVAQTLNTLSGLRKVRRIDAEIKTNLLDSVPQELDGEGAVEWLLTQAPQRLSPTAMTRFNQVYGGLEDLLKSRRAAKQEKVDEVFPVFVQFVDEVRDQLDDPKLNEDEKRQLLAKGITKYPQLAGYKPFQDLRTTLKVSDAMKAAGGGIKDEKLFSMERSLAKEFKDENKDFIIKQTAANTISNLSDSPAGDLALVFAYMKLLDPTSAVREAEYANAANAAGVPDRVRAAYNNVLEGAKLAPAQRTMFRSEADRIYAAALNGYRKTRKRYLSTASQYPGINPDRTIPELESIDSTFDTQTLMSEIAGKRAKSGKGRL